MNTPGESVLLETALAIRPGRFLLLLAPSAERDPLAELVAALALCGPLQLVAASDWCSREWLEHSLRRRIENIDQVLGHVRLARAISCYQLADWLAWARPEDEPLLVLDFLQPFYDPAVPATTRFRMFRQSCLHLARLAWHKPVGVTVQQAAHADYAFFYPFLCAVADEVLLPGPDQADP